MNIRKFSLAIVSIAAIAPAVASASPEDAALNACAKAFASSLASGGSGAPTFKLNYDQQRASSSVASYFVRNYSFTMQAQDRKSGTALASATCSTDNRGRVIELTALPVAAGATLAAR